LPGTFRTGETEEIPLAHETLEKISINESTSQLKAPKLAIVGHLWLETMEFSYFLISSHKKWPTMVSSHKNT